MVFFPFSPGNGKLLGLGVFSCHHSVLAGLLCSFTCGSAGGSEAWFLLQEAAPVGFLPVWLLFKAQSCSQQRRSLSIFEGLMASASGPVSAELLQPGSGSLLPPSSLTDEDLASYPGLSHLLMGLTKHMDSSGLSTNLAQQLEEAKKELHLSRTNWLKWEALHRVLREALRDLGTGPAAQEKKFLEILERQLLVGELKRILDVGPSAQEVQPSLLGLVPSDLQDLLPPNQELKEMQKRIPVELERQLKHKCLAVLSYFCPESDSAGEIPRAVMIGTLAESVAAEKRRLQEARARHQELVGLLEQQTAAYPQVLLRCLALLKHFAREFRLGAQSELDCLNTQYLEIKCSAMFLKIRLEEVSILLETYEPEKVNVHRVMRDNLQAAIRREEQELAASCKVLSSYETLGPEFEELVKEYARLQAIIENRRWVLTEFNKD
ncbi:HAUS augmin-like complex subunit 4 isoform X1 [Sphaerodactylus townsendi]|uniref:HAUS augmin-like complex subunit 4 isoform X1 n=2 Tax=Sphaerodactylus townsendi TaxID=933632 RepID=UPI0020275460|nr:HAUS augmin-like complex subunit 4 isoform X1 [Sphaerodactylus townsendi]